MRRAIFSALGLVAVCAVLAWEGFSGFGREAPSPIVPAEGRDEGLAPVSQPSLAPPVARPLQSEATLPSSPRRSEMPSPALAGAVLDRGGSVVPGAVVTWTRLPRDMAEGLLVAPSAEEIERLTISTRSDASGRFGFPDAPPSDAGAPSVLWASEPGHKAAYAWLDADPSSWPGDIRLELGSSPSTTVRVVSGERPVAGALVEQRGVLDGATSQALAHALFRRIFQTADGGSAALAPIDGVVELLASKDRSSSLPHRDVLSEEQVLRLGDSFEAAGLVVFESGVALQDPLRVVVTLVEEQERPLVALLVAADGSFGPARLPHVEGAQYAFRTQGGGMAPDEATYGSPGAGGRLQVELVAAPGHGARFVLASEGKRLDKGSVTLDWQADDGRRGRVARTVDERGEASFLGLPAGSIVPTGRAPGHVVARQGTYRVPEQTVSAWTIALYPAGSLSGLVRLRGEPVEDFTVLLWPSAAAYLQEERSFRGRPDGHFEVEDAPCGSVSILAWAQGSARSPVVQVEVFREGNAQEVMLELGEPIVLTGEVVNEEGVALAEASASLFFADQGNLAGPLGSAARADGLGRFRIEHAPAGDSTCVVRAPGYSAQVIDVPGERAGPIDLGRILLSAQQELAVHLRGSHGIDPTRFFVAASGEDLPPRAFSAEGVVRYEQVDAGVYDLLLTHPDRSIEMQPIWLRGGEEWSVTLDIESGASLLVDLRGDAPEESRLPLKVQVVGAEGYVGGLRTLQIGDSREGLRIDALSPGDLVVTALDAADTLLARQVTKVVPGENRVRLEIDRPPLVVVVVDARGEPVAGAQVSLFQMPAGVHLGDASCDANGECRFRGVGEGGTPLLATVTHEAHGIASGLPLEVPHDLADPALLVLEPDASIVLRIQDGDEPQEGVVVELCDELPTGHVLVASPPSRADGTVRWDRLAAGTYHAVVHQDPRYWRGDAHVLAGSDPAPAVLQLRRRADLRLRLADAAGLPIEGVALTVISQQYGRPITDFAPSGFMDVEPASGRTDEGGELLLSRIPRGRYTWQVTFADGSSQSGEVDVPGWQEALVSIVR